MKKLVKLLTLTAILCVICSCALFTACEIHQHEYAYTVTKEATCEFEGINYGYCSCGKVDEKIIPALGHVFKNNVCTECGFNRTSDHVHTEVIDKGFAPTCESFGLTDGSHCKDCNIIITKQEIIPATGHNFSNYVYDNNATCEQDGTKTARCSNGSCKLTNTVTAKNTKTEHKYVSTTIAPTCTAKGYTVYVCACGDNYIDNYVNTVPHVYNQELAREEYLKTPVTCKAPAEYYKSCSCGKKGSESFVYGGTLAHSYSNEWSYNSTHHWHETTCGCDSKSNFNKHSPVNGFCSQCNIPTESTVGVVYDLSADGTYAEVIDFVGTDTTIVISNQYQGKPVTSICDSSFESTNIKEIILPDTLQTIGLNAFDSCHSLTSIIIPESVTYIGDKAFYNCSLLTSVVIPNTVTAIPSSAFRGCSSLTSVEIPSSVTSIGDYAFRYCSSLTSVVIPESVTSIGSEAFSYCSSLTSVVIPESVTYIGDKAFYYCSSLTSVTFLGENCNLTSISSNAFSGCSKLQFNIHGNAKYLGNSNNPYKVLIAGTNSNISTLTVHPNTQFIANSAFENYTRLYTVEIPDTVTSIGSDAFSGCSSITNLTAPGLAISYVTKSKLQSVSITSGIIGGEAFFGCSSLTSVVIGENVTSIGNNAFYNCPLIEYTVEGELKYLGNPTNPYIYLAGVSSQDIASVNINQNCKFIGSSAFRACSSLISVVIPESVTSIGDNAFYNCPLIEYTVEGGLKYLGNPTNPYIYLASVSSQDIASANINQNCKFIGSYAFYNCSSLTSVEIPESVTSIGYSAFRGCSSLTSVEIPDTVTLIASYAFSDCDSLTSVVIPESVTSIGDSAFYSCSSLTSVVIGESVTSIGYNAFSYCSSLTSVVFGESVTSIGQYAFYGCSSLTSVIIPKSVTSIGFYAFANCSSLTVYCEATSKPSSWDSNWNSSGRPVVWGYEEN